MTGIMPYVAGLPAKEMELAREIVPGARNIGMLANSNDPKGPPQLQELEAAGKAVGVRAIAGKRHARRSRGRIRNLPHQRRTLSLCFKHRCY